MRVASFSQDVEVIAQKLIYAPAPLVAVRVKTEKIIPGGGGAPEPSAGKRRKEFLPLLVINIT
jgi:hypothetical protein